jgi:hypothetical protein
MATTTFASLLADVVPSVMGCSDPLAVYHLRAAAIELCTRSAVWVHEPASASVISTDFPYTLVLPTDTQPVLVKTVYFDGTLMAPWAPAAANLSLEDWRDITTSSPNLFIMETPTTMRLVPAPEVAGDLTMRVAIAPSWDATGMDADLLNVYRMGIVSGALSRLCSIPGTPFVNPPLAATHAALFGNAITQASIDARRGFSPAPLRVQFNRIM